MDIAPIGFYLRMHLRITDEVKGMRDDKVVRSGQIRSDKFYSIYVNSGQVKSIHNIPYLPRGHRIFHRQRLATSSPE